MTYKKSNEGHEVERGIRNQMNDKKQGFILKMSNF